MATVIHFESESDLCHEFPCFELFNPESRREVFEIRREHGQIVWCSLSEVSHLLKRSFNVATFEGR